MPFDDRRHDVHDDEFAEARVLQRRCRRVTQTETTHDDLQGLAAALDAGGEIRGELAGLLAPGEIAALRARVTALLEVGTFPEPGPGRPFPWPPI